MFYSLAKVIYTFYSSFKEFATFSAYVDTKNVFFIFDVGFSNSKDLSRVFFNILEKESLLVIVLDPLKLNAPAFNTFITK